mmetsp:Transcript_86146/g.244295  ORF Transcript_86146/g.244295 Transcript_86146/m.244295 type:complete len:116 (+) Transcript_86146:51-398(+)
MSLAVCGAPRKLKVMLTSNMPFDLDVTPNRVWLDDWAEEVLMTEQYGPVMLSDSGESLVPGVLGAWPSMVFAQCPRNHTGGNGFKRWQDMTATERGVAVHMIAKRNRKLRERFEW